MKYDFCRGTTAAQAARNINDVFGTGATTKRTTSRWFKKFASANFDLSNEPRGRPDPKVNNDQPKAAIESDPSQSARDLSTKFGVTKQTILTHLAEIGKVKNLDKLT